MIFHDVLAAMTEAAERATAAAMARGHARDSPEVERSAWHAAHRVYRELAPDDFIQERVDR